MGLERAAAFFIAGAALLVSVPAAADPPPAPTVPVAPPAALAPLAPAGAAPLPLERRNPVAMSGGIAATSIGSILIVGGALAGVLQAACTGECDHTPVIVGLLAVGGTLVAVGIPLILYGSKTVPTASGTVALAPRKPLPSWAGAPGSRGWAIRF